MAHGLKCLTNRFSIAGRIAMNKFEVGAAGACYTD